MGDTPLMSILKAALIAGLVAGLVVAAFHYVVTEPLIEQAIALEEQLSAAVGGPDEPPVVSRDVQRLGLWVGFLLYGLSWALPFGIAYYLAERWLPGSEALRRGLILALLGYWSVGLFPFLKYPANPPGVGDPATIVYRQRLYLGFLVISVASSVLTVAIGRSLARSLARGWRWLPTLAFLGVFSLVVYLAMPGNPDPIHMPADLVANFRVLSLAGLTLFWAVLGFSFGWLMRSSPRA